MSSTYDPIADSKAMNLALYGQQESPSHLGKRWYWQCSACNIKTKCAASEAVTMADSHDKECHKKKPTTSFGWEVTIPYNSHVPWGNWFVLHKADKNKAEVRWRQLDVDGVTDDKHFMAIQSERELIFCDDDGDGITIGKEIYTFLMGNGQAEVSDHISISAEKSKDHIMKWAKRYCGV